MSIREIFAANLRGLTAKRGAIARLNEATGIGRVQLNRYMKGTLPNDQNIELIAEHFDISGDALFQRDFLAGRHSSGAVHEHIDRIKRGILDGNPADIEPGRYMVYIKSAVSDELINQSPMFVRKIGGYTTFRRYTDVINNNSDGISPYRSIHDGFARKPSETYFLLGANIRNGRETTLLSLNRFQIGAPAFLGTAIVLSERGPISARTLVVWTDSQSGPARDFIAQARLLAPREAEHAALLETVL